MFAEHRATGRNLVLQFVWVYERAIDFDGLKRFTTISDTACWDGASSVLRCPSPGIGGSQTGGRQTSISPNAPVHALNLATGPMNAHNYLLIPNVGQAGVSASFHLWTARPLSAW